MNDPLIASLIAMDKNDVLRQKYMADLKSVAQDFGLTANEKEQNLSQSLIH
ncbi:hypothetical protein [uncultured Paraglaciecola sp.]|uniref:hypothetical protein n=1 Tax=uncultured Paraglaciecola sp. TaxID=1765024 RepID=UPI00259791C5|nr:hypothetical protein [uncultured Paraglaciecola sp.]